MIQTIKYSNKNFPISSNLIFEKVLNLEETLDGQSVKISSAFNPKDKDPSMVIFLDDKENIYRFKDFSTGLYGDAAELVQHLYNIPSRQDAFRKILDIFKNDTSARTVINYEKEVKEISKFTIRKWLTIDANYWKVYGIGGSFLKKYNIKPLQSYTVKITKGSVVQEMEFKNPMCYGFFNAKGELCKIYNPSRKTAKFVKVQEYTQGEDQLTYNKRCLIIASSLKDIGAFMSLKFNNIDLVAPDSENVTITPEQIAKYKESYEFVFTMFDNDVAGMKAMKKYKDLYGIPYIYFTVEKDMADCVKEHGPVSTKVLFTPVLQDAIKNSKNCKASAI
jgi:hypothetical protein